jgi:hypothetical protein
MMGWKNERWVFYNGGSLLKKPVNDAADQPTTHSSLKETWCGRHCVRRHVMRGVRH